MSEEEAKPHRRRTIGEVRNWLSAAESLIVDSRHAVDDISFLLPETSGSDPLQKAREMVALYRRRDELFRLLGAQDMFADPAWHMLMDLFLTAKSQRQVSVSSLCIASLSPPTTALRHISVMVEKGILVKTPDPNDSRRIFISLSPQALTTMEGIFG